MGEQPTAEASLRLFLLFCRMPGEAPRWDRMFEALIAVHFRENGPGPFADADAAHALCFAMIVLNTEQHSSQIKRKRSVEEFERDMRGLNGGGDLDAAFLQRTYASIKAHEIAMRPVRESLRTP